MRLKHIALLIVVTLCLNTALAAKPSNSKRNKKSDTKTEQQAPAKPETKKEEGTPLITSVIKEGAKYNNGLFSVVEQKGLYYILLPTEDLGKDYLMVTRISKAPAGLRSGMTGYSGDPVSEEMIRFSLSPDSTTVFLQSIVTRELPRDSTGTMNENVERSNFQPLVEALAIKGKNKAADTLLIDVTPFIGGDNELTSISAWSRRTLNIAGFQKTRSYIEGVKSFPINTEFRTVKTYMHTPAGKSWDGKPWPSRPVSFELNTSIIELPEEKMQPRYYDQRVGYFTEYYVDFDKNPQGVKNMQLITRWKLEPKAEDMEAYKRGELVEPEKPIIFYIDPTTPEKWVNALIQGVNDWEPAFRHAGFKNAIRAERAPVGDSTWSLEDARHSAIVYKPSTIPNASGPNIHDPRTGEILESHINWYHNVMLLLRNWYMIQAGVNNPDAQQMTFPDELMSELIRFVSSHEVGHTLGLRHNFIGSFSTPVDSLRNAAYLEEFGHCTSIMDYCRFNYVVQPEDNIDPTLQFPRINDYDNWAIEWGYRRFPEFASADEEKEFINEWTIENLKNPRLAFGTEMSQNDPRLQSEDIGDNQMTANALGMKNLERVMAALPEWTATPGEGQANLSEMYSQVITQYSRYVGHVAKWVGGIYETPKTIEQGTDIYEFAPKDKQVEAMKWLNTYFFTTPQWIYNSEIFERTGKNSIDIATTIYRTNMYKIVSTRIIGNLIAAEAELGTKAYTVTNYFNTLYSYVFSNKVSASDRVKQKVYVETLLSYVPVNGVPSRIKGTDTAAVIIAELRSIQTKLQSASSSNKVVDAHYKYLVQLIKDKLDNK